MVSPPACPGLVSITGGELLPVGGGSDLLSLSGHMSVASLSYYARLSSEALVGNPVDHSRALRVRA
jgi:hypothetical protein